MKVLFKFFLQLFNKIKMKPIKLISWFLGIVMFMFGILKVIIPTIRGWYAVQMTNSGLSEYIPVWIGVMGEIVVGLTLIISLTIANNLTNKSFKIIIQLASAGIIAMMLTAVYVHLQPAVPAEVLPLKIKPPYIPIFILLLALANIYFIRRQTTYNTKIEHTNYSQQLATTNLSGSEIDY
jgi:hypothetical protein